MGMVATQAKPLLAGGVANRYRANVAHIRESRPDSGIGFLIKVLDRLRV